jgi:phosphoribosylformylglycinamidine synthase
VDLRVEESVCAWLDPAHAGRLVRMPINHNEGNFICSEQTLQALCENRQIVLRYAAPDGSSPAGQAPNGATNNIAGICNAAGNVFGLMPHPERVVDGVSGCTDGTLLFAYLARRMEALE